MARRQRSSEGVSGAEDGREVLGDAEAADEPPSRHRAAFLVPALVESDSVPAVETARRRAKGAVKPGDLVAYLRDQDAPALVDLILEELEISADFKRRLTLKVATGSGPRDGGPSVATLRKLITSATLTSRYIDSRKVKAYAARLDEVVEALTGLFASQADARTALAVVDLVGYAVERLEEAQENISDSAGRIQGILHQLSQLHMRATYQARPEPKSLAAFLFRRRLRSVLPEFIEYRDVYGEALGEEGMAEFRRLAEELWAQVPARGLGRADNGYDYPGSYRRITAVMEQLAREDGDVDALVAVKSRDLSSPRAFLEIADALRSANRDDEALEWAERARAAFLPDYDSGIVTFLVEEYRSRGREDEAVGLLRDAFDRNPKLETYTPLIEYLRDRGDADLLSAQRAAALDRLRADPNRPFTGELLRIQLWEGDLPAALLEAMSGRQPLRMVVELAERIATSHTEDAIAILEPAVNSCIANGSSSYPDAVMILVKLRTLYRMLHREADWNVYIAGLKRLNGRRSGLMHEMSMRGL